MKVGTLILTLDLVLAAAQLDEDDEDDDGDRTDAFLAPLRSQGRCQTRSFVALLIGPGGRKLRELVNLLRIISVRGDATAGGGGGGEDGLHVFLEGSSLCVEIRRMR